MTYTPIPTGTQSWDVPVNAAFVDQDTRITTNTADAATNASGIAALANAATFPPQSHGFLAWSMDANMVTNATAPTNGVVQMTRFDINRPVVITNMHEALVAAGAGVSNTFLGIYDSTGTLLRQTADASTAYQSADLKTVPLTSTLSIAAGTYYFARLVGAGSSITLLRGVQSANLVNAINANLTVSNGRVTNFGSGLTALPSSITLSSRTFGSTGFWCAIS